METDTGMQRGRLVRAVVRGLLWGLLLAVIGGLAVVTLRGRSGRSAPPPVLSALPDFALTNRDGRAVSRADLAGEAWVADFIFTRCAGPCPLMTRRMAELGERLPEGVRRVSFTVDPGHDTPEVLDAYAERHGAPDSWLFLTGPREAIWELSVAGFKLGVAGDAAAAGEGAEAEQAGAPPDHAGPILHSTRFVLVDGAGRIRGYYDAFEEEGRERLLREARAVAGSP